MVTQVPATAWRSLLEVANRFAALNPWEWIQDTQVVIVVHPATGENVYCSILGHAGEMRALSMYRGKQGWKSYLAIGGEDLDTDPEELVYGQECLILSFDSPQEADRDDLALLQHAGFTVAEDGMVPSFRSYRAGYLPQPPDLDEVSLLQTVTEQMIALVGALPGSGEHIPDDGLDADGKILAWVLAPDGWEFQWRKPDSTLDFSPPTVNLAAEDRARAMELPQEPTIWLMEDFHLPDPMVNEEEVAFFPRVFLFFDVEVQEYRGISLTEPDHFPDGIGSLLVEMMEQQGMMPQEIVVSKRSNLILMRPFCQALGIGIHLEEAFDIRNDLRAAVQKMMHDTEE